MEGGGQFGSAYAYSRVVAGHQVTAVGEVPAATVEFLAAAVVPGRAAAEDVGTAASGLVAAPARLAPKERRP